MNAKRDYNHVVIGRSNRNRDKYVNAKIAFKLNYDIAMTFSSIFNHCEYFRTHYYICI